MKDQEFYDIIKKIISNRKFKKLKNEQHHLSTNRYQHNIDVAYKVYKLTKALNWDYKTITIAAVMHDYYFDEDFNRHSVCLFNHGSVSLKNAKNLTVINELQENIILSHMFPFCKKMPKYKESIMVNLVDDYIFFKEVVLANKKLVNL